MPYRSTSSFSTPSLTVITGFNKVSILELSSQNSALNNLDLEDQSFKPLTFNVNLGAIQAAHIYHYQGYNWLVVAGQKGVCVLLDDQERGFSVDQTLTPDTFARMSFKKISDTENVKKIASIDNMLYLLTHTQLKALNRNNNKEALVAKSGTASVFNHTYFTDMIVTRDLLILGTSQGLLANKKGSGKWKSLYLPECVGSLDGISPVSHLYAYTASGFEEDLDKEGNLYVLNGYPGCHQSYIYRFALENGSLNLLPDFYVRNERTFFADLGNYYTCLLNDGAHLMGALNRQRHLIFEELYGDIIQPYAIPAQISIFAPDLKSSFREIYTTIITPEIATSNSHRMVGLVRSLSTGAIVAAGDFGIRINN